MNIGKYNIISGPYISWCLSSCIFLYGTMATGNWWWVGSWTLLNITIIPICFWIKRKKK